MPLTRPYIERNEAGQAMRLVYPPAPKPECVVNGVVLDKCASRLLDGTCRRCGKRK